MLERSGERVLAGTRSGIVTADTYPSGATQAGSFAVPQEARGAISHITLDGTASSTISMIGHLYGYLTETTQWYHLGGIRNGATITPTSGAGPIAESTNNARVSESFDHVSFYDRLFVAITTLSGTGADVTARYYFEGPKRSTS